MSKNSFFGQFKRSVMKHIESDSKKSAQDPEGRFLAICLKTALEENKELGKKLFGSDLIAASGGFYTTEFSFKKGRRADLAIVGGLNQPLGLIEIKCEDRFLRGQLKAYVNFCLGQNKIPFRLICRYPSMLEEKEVRDLLPRGKGALEPMTTSYLYELLKSFPEKKFPKTHLLKEYLMESEKIYSRVIPSDLKFLATRMFVNGSKNSRVTPDRLNDLGAGISAMNSNMEIISENVLQRCQGKTLGFSIFRDVSIDHSIKVKCLSNGKKRKVVTLSEDIKKKAKDKVAISTMSLSASKFFKHGQICFYSLLKANKSKWEISLEFGYYTHTDGTKETKLYRYSGVSEPLDGKSHYWRKKAVKGLRGGGWQFESQETEMKMFLRMMKDSSNAYLLENGSSRDSQEKKLCKALRGLLRNLEE